MTLGEKIKLVRQKKKMSQGDLANVIGIYQKNISRYEQGSTDPSASVLKKIADALDVTSDYLLSEDDSSVTIKDTILLQKFEIIQGLEDDTKIVVNKFLDLIIRDHKAKQAYAS